MGVYYRAPDQQEEADDTAYRQLKLASQLQALVLRGYFNHPNICWKGSRTRHSQSGRFLQSIDDNILAQVSEEPKRKDVLIELVLRNSKELFEDVKAGSCLGCSDYEMVKFRILCGRCQATSRITTLTSKELTLVSELD